ncbi:MAG: UDP-glucose 4-epimerase GalE [Pseudomonadota bacterium]
MGHILVTGGAGYIGSHTSVELLSEEHQVTVLDNLSNSSRASIDAVKRLTNKELEFVEGDLRDEDLLRDLFAQRDFSAVMHFGGLKAVGESVAQPLRYYDNNVHGTLCLLRAMDAAGCKQFVFSSSATVYGDPVTVPITEDFATGATNPYGQSKLMVEEILRDFHVAHDDWRISILRYFNPVGAHVSGEIGEDPNGIPNNLMPYISQVAVGKLPRLRVFGDDYPTRDGTGVRDYIHVVDLAQGHLRALDYLSASDPQLAVHNLGTGTGYSVLEALKAFETACGKSLPFEIVERRPGDIAECYANPERAANDLSWRARYGIEQMCEDAWRWQSNYPDGFGSATG